MHSLKVFTTRNGMLIELDGQEIRGADLSIRVRGGRTLATIVVPVDDLEMDVDIEKGDAISRKGVHRFALRRGQAFLDGRPIAAENVEVNTSPDGESGTVDLTSVPVIFEKKEKS